MVIKRMNPKFSVSQFLAAVNQTLEYAYPVVVLEGEVASFKINQEKYVFFDLKDDSASIGCFMTVWQLRVPLEDGMKVVVNAQPKLTPWGKFSLTIQSVRLSGEGSIKKGFELLKSKLEQEGLFTDDRKRLLPSLPSKIGVISSTQAAGYADFIKIINQRWGGLEIEVAHTQVQGEVAPDQIIRALNYFNQQAEPVDVIAIIRGGGSADDLAAFNDEQLVRAIAASRIPTLIGVGHETDVTLADLAGDVRAATPTNAAQIIIPDKYEIIAQAKRRVLQMGDYTVRCIETDIDYVRERMMSIIMITEASLDGIQNELVRQRELLRVYDPTEVLRRGYALVRGEAVVGGMIDIETIAERITAEVKNVESR